jgi:methylglutaconyl-CoA hydratase
MRTAKRGRQVFGSEQSWLQSWRQSWRHETDTRSRSRARACGHDPSTDRVQSFEVSDVTFQTIAVEVSARRIATVLLNRPERGNAFDQVMLDELGEAFAALGAGEEARVVVLRGSGRHFCTSADLAARAAATPAPPPPAATAHFSLRDVLAALDALPKPTLAVVHGAAVGGGAAFAACCDAVIAADSAFFSIPEVRVGMPPLGVAPFLVRAIGHRNFRRYGLSGERITALEALRLGLAHQICAADALEETWTRIADAFLQGAPGAIKALKSATAQYASPTLSAILAAQAAQDAKQDSKHDPNTLEALEGIASFREKRKPSWYPP